MFINEILNEDAHLTQADIVELEKFADKIFAKVGIDVNFTRHFLDRVNDERNGKQITLAELTRLFKQEQKRWGKKIAQLGPDAEAVMKDLQTDINMPFVLVWDKDNEELDLIAKTVMRKKNFKHSNPGFPVESTVNEAEVDYADPEHRFVVVWDNDRRRFYPVGIEAWADVVLPQGFKDIDDAIAYGEELTAQAVAEEQIDEVLPALGALAGIAARALPAIARGSSKLIKRSPVTMGGQTPSSNDKNTKKDSTI